VENVRLRPRLPAICGNATLAIELSSTSINAASATAEAISHGLTFGFHRLSGKAGAIVTCRSRYCSADAGARVHTPPKDRGICLASQVVKPAFRVNDTAGEPTPRLQCAPPPNPPRGEDHGDQQPAEIDSSRSNLLFTSQAYTTAVSGRKDMVWSESSTTDGAARAKSIMSNAFANSSARGAPKRSRQLKGPSRRSQGSRWPCPCDNVRWNLCFPMVGIAIAFTLKSGSIVSRAAVAHCAESKIRVWL